jgi:cytidyltransferase-like protein
MTTKVIYPGTFDPIHNAHIEILDQIREHLKKESKNPQFLILPYPKAPFGKNPASFKHRLEMLRRAIQNHKDISILQLDPTLTPKDCYEYLAKNFIPDYSIIGSDYTEKMAEEVGVKKIVEKGTQLLMSVRPGHEPSPTKGALIVKNPERKVDVSATQLRSGRLLNGLVPKKVADYIEKHKLYKHQN